MKIFIQPSDVLFFRDGKPFEAGGDHIARLNFPPTPITFYGAIRTALISLELQNFDDFKDSNNLSQDMKDIVGYVQRKSTDVTGKPIYSIYNGSLEITSFGIGTLNKGKVKKLYPMPADVVKIKGEEKYFILAPERISDKEKINMPIQDFLLLTNKNTKGKFLEQPPRFLTEEGFDNYLNNDELNESHFIQTDDLFMGEPRVCVSRDFRTHTAKEGMLYSIEFARMYKETGFYLELKGLDKFETRMKKQEAVRLGGESKVAICQYDTDWNPPIKVNISKNIKLITLTPSIFEKGWLPDFIDTDGNGNIDGVDVKLVSAAMKKNIGIGGWDIVNNKSKPVRRSVPAGSVFYFQTTDRNIEKLKTKQFINIGQETEKGLGQAIIGGF